MEAALRSHSGVTLKDNGERKIFTMARALMVHMIICLAQKEKGSKVGI